MQIEPAYLIIQQAYPGSLTPVKHTNSIIMLQFQGVNTIPWDFFFPRIAFHMLLLNIRRPNLTM